MRRILIANRGEIVSRVARSARARGVATVGVYSTADAGLPYLSDVDEAIALAGVTPAETYLDIPALLAAAERTGCDAVHPGYGFLAENAGFAKAVTDAGLDFVGPPAECVAAMGSKVRAKELARRASVPVLPDAVLDAGATPEKIAALAEGVGFPLLVKASAGGGGRGIRLVSEAGQLADAVAAAGREAAAAFGDPTLFLERYLAAPRHVEVQIMADVHGTVLHVGDRECSVQRRHQKLLEEAPAVLVDPAVRAEMAAAAVRLAAEIGYVGAGTCEFLVAGDDFFFLEMNTRLQVEHTVTEEVTGLDLVDLQLAVAAGQPLPLAQEDIVLSGHAIQARVCAEDPAAGWLPSSGLVSTYEHDTDPWLRFENGIESGSTISPHYDSMIAKVIAAGPDRTTTIDRLDAALRGIRLHGPVTNIGALTQVLRAGEYRAGAISVNWFESRPELSQPSHGLPASAVAAMVAASVAWAEPFVTGIAPAWSNTPRTPITLRLSGDHEVTYLPPRVAGAEFEHFALDGEEHRVRLIARPERDTRTTGTRDSRDGNARLAVEVDGRLSVVRVAGTGSLDEDSGGTWWVNGAAGQVCFSVEPRFAESALARTAGGPRSPMPGTVLETRVADGQAVTEGQALVVVEAMKMEHVITAAADGVVERVLVSAGQSVEAGQLLVEFKEETA